MIPMDPTITKQIPRAALYLRVSTREQTTENQELELRRWAERLSLDVVKVYADTASGARSPTELPPMRAGEDGGQRPSTCSAAGERQARAGARSPGR